MKTPPEMAKVARAKAGERFRPGTKCCAGLLGRWRPLCGSTVLPIEWSIGCASRATTDSQLDSPSSRVPHELSRLDPRQSALLSLPMTSPLLANLEQLLA